MTTIEMEAQKAELARHILNVDNMEVIAEVKKAYNLAMARLAKNNGSKTEPDSKEYVLNGLKEAFLQLKDIKAGQLKGRPAEELLKELEEEK